MMLLGKADWLRLVSRAFFCSAITLVLAACDTVPVVTPEVDEARTTPDYRIGPGDSIQIFVWRNAELSLSLPVRPDGRISTPLVEDMLAAGKTPTELARDVEKELSTYIKSPVVTVIVTGFSGPFADQIRVLGEAAQPQALPYRDGMTLLDVMISVGGLTNFADGNKASIIRVVDGEEKQYPVRIYDLIKKGDVSVNLPVLPGDILIIPEAFF